MAETAVEFPGFTGSLLHPGEPAYEEARTVFNAMIDNRPLVIARCACTADVVAAVRHARARGLEISVYGGGHGVTGAAVTDGGVCIDLRGMKQVEVDPEARVARVDGGLTWGELDAATQAHGLAVTGGRVSTTGVGGLALGSGSGWIERSFGFTCDNLLEAEVVTADGEVVTASESKNPDLFWALRGGSGNFGIVTRFTFRLHPVGPIVFGGMLVFPAARAREVVCEFRDFMAEAPEEVGAGLAFITAPHADFVPEPARGQPVVGIVCCYTGRADDGPAPYEPLLALEPAVAMVQPMPYVAVQQLLDPSTPKGLQHYWTADFLAELPDEAVETLVQLATAPVSPLTQVILIPGGGAIARVPEDATAFGNRTAPFNIHYLSMWADPADTSMNIDYTKRLAGSMKPWTTGGVYLNFLGDEGTSRVEAGFGPEKFARLRQIKAKWDPHNVFHRNQNIPPAAEVPEPR
jgi:FAD/FMN-containing dehydrogenase